MDNEVFVKNLTESEISFNCPHCEKGNIHFDSETNDTRRIYNPNWTQDDNIEWEDVATQINGTFSYICNCSNTRCGEKTLFAGITHHEFDGIRAVYSEYDEEHGYPRGEHVGEDMVFKTVYEIKYTNPPVLFFPISDHVPTSVKTSLLKSFDIFWHDQNSAADLIRITIEKILDDKNVPKEGTLHHRIGVSEKIKGMEEYAKILTGIKWLGNAGAHGDTVERKDVVDAFKAIKFILHELYDRSPQTDEASKIGENLDNQYKPKKI